MTSPLTPLSEEFSQRLREQLHRLLMHFEEIRLITPALGAWAPPVDLCEMEDAIIVRIEIPGVSRENVRVTMRDGLLKIEGQKERQLPALQQEAEGNRLVRFICLERAYGAFVRHVPLKWMIDLAAVSARLVDGILEIRLPKSRECGREIAIPITDESGL